MIPIRDVNPSLRPPVVTTALITCNVLVFMFELSLGEDLTAFLFTFGTIPKKWLLMDQYPHITPISMGFTYLTSQFIHGGWVHLAGNMWYLWLFGDNIEGRLGPVRFLFFYLLTGIAAGAIHTFFNIHSSLPAVGASGAIAGVLGAYLVLYPHARIITLVPIFFYFEIIELPAVIVLGFWFFIQFFSGAASIGSTAQSAGGGVAWWAHIGGFLAGIFLLYLFLPGQEGEEE